MDFDGGGGIGGGFGYGNGYTPLANQAIANNNANYWGNQAYASGVGAYDPFAQSGGFGNQTAYYAGLGADYSRAGMTGNVFGPIGGGGGGSGGLATLPGGGVDPNDPGNIAEYYRIMSGGYGSPGGFNQSAQDPYSQPGWGSAPSNPDPYKLLGYDPNNPFVGMSGTSGGIGSDAARAPNQQWNTPYSTPGGYNPYDPSTFAPSAQKNVGSSGGLAMLPGGGVDPNDPGNIAKYYEIMNGGGGGGGGSSFNDRWDPLKTVDWNKWATQTVAPQTGGISNQQPNPWGTYEGYNPLDPATYGGNGYGQIPGAMPDQNKLLGYTPATLPGGGLNPNDPGNIAKYYEIMNGGRDQLARTMQQNMMPQAPVQQGGGLGSSGFGPYGGTGYTGQPGYGLGIGATGAGGVNVGNTFGTSGQNPSFGGSPSYGYGGFPGSLSNDLMPPQPNETPNIRPWLGS
jgi:hypothetical protein